MSTSELTAWHSPAGDFTLERLTPDPTKSLRAWDAADEFLLTTVMARALQEKNGRWLILNDEFGALTTALKSLAAEAKLELFSTQVVNDSYIGCRATSANLIANGIEADAQILSTLNPLGEPFDVVLCKIPKSLAMLEDQLHRLRTRITPASVVLSAAMIKHMAAGVQPLFERIIGGTTTTRAVKKARVLESIPDLSLVPGANPYPTFLSTPDLPAPLLHHAGVFSIKRLDRGSLLLGEHIRKSAEPSVILDLGCGSGLLGLLAAARNPSADLIFVDESAAAIESATANWKSLFPTRKAAFFHQDSLAALAPQPVDLILCNPPFHEKYHLSSLTAERMFRESRTALATGGHLLVVGNRHLSWAASINRLFGNCRQLAHSRKFIVHTARKR